MSIKNDFAGSAPYYDIILGEESFRKHSSFVGKTLRRYGVKTVLELACGTGLYLFPLKKQGFTIEGLDISKEMLKEAKKQDKKITLYCQDMTTFSTHKEYDAILILNSSLILLPNHQAINKTIQQCNKHLRKGGILFLDLPNHEKEIRENNHSQSHEEYKTKKAQINVIFRDYKKKDRWVSQWHGFIKEKNIYEEFIEHYEELIYDHKKLEKILEKNDFVILRTYGSRNGGAFNKKTSWRRAYLCQKTL